MEDFAHQCTVLYSHGRLCTSDDFIQMYNHGHDCNESFARKLEICRSSPAETWPKGNFGRNWTSWYWPSGFTQTQVMHVRSCWTCFSTRTKEVLPSTKGNLEAPVTSASRYGKDCTMWRAVRAPFHEGLELQVQLRATLHYGHWSSRQKDSNTLIGGEQKFVCSVFTHYRPTASRTPTW